MKGYSLHQPYATAVVNKAKGNETRDWNLKHRGLFFIHAAKRWTREEDFACDTLLWRAALAIEPDEEAKDVLPFGAIVGYVEVVASRSVASFTANELRIARHREGFDGTWTEYDMGNYGPGRFAHVFINAVAIEPIPWKGQQGIFEIPDRVIFEAKTLEVAKVA